MNFNFSRSQINRLIIHRIFKKERDQDYSAVEHDNNIYSVDEDGLDTISTRIQQAIGKKTKSFNAKIMRVDEDSFFKQAQDLWQCNQEDFIEKSRNIADLLGSAQTTMRPDGGFVVVMDGEMQDSRRGFVIVIKAELQQAFKRTFDEVSKKNKLELLTDLFLSPDKRFFKIGLIVQGSNQEESFPNDRYTAILYDEQFQSDKKPATYFSDKFLGFSLAENGAFLTRDWFVITHKVITRWSEDGHQRKELLKALSTYLDVELGNEIDPAEFSRRYLPDGRVRDKYFEKVMSQEKFQRRFVKDKAIMGQRETTHKMPFPNKVVIQGKADNFQDLVKVIRTEEEAIQEINDTQTTLVSIKGRPYSQGDE